MKAELIHYVHWITKIQKMYVTNISLFITDELLYVVNLYVCVVTTLYCTECISGHNCHQLAEISTDDITIGRWWTRSGIYIYKITGLCIWSTFRDYSSLHTLVSKMFKSQTNSKIFRAQDQIHVCPNKIDKIKHTI